MRGEEAEEEEEEEESDGKEKLDERVERRERERRRKIKLLKKRNQRQRSSAANAVARVLKKGKLSQRRTPRSSLQEQLQKLKTCFLLQQQVNTSTQQALSLQRLRNHNLLNEQEMAVALQRKDQFMHTILSTMF